MKTVKLFVADKDMFQRIIKTSQKGLWDGGEPTDYFFDCMWYTEKYQCSIIFTRDIGHHESGWWKNPDYERCYHLSISFLGERNIKNLNKLLDGLFGANKKLIWEEPPYSKEGKAKEIWHYRLFCDANWKAILPRGEVYNTDLTEIGWKSFSEKNFK